jgi:hypothetical protein
MIKQAFPIVLLFIDRCYVHLYIAIYKMNLCSICGSRAFVEGGSKTDEV